MALSQSDYANVKEVFKGYGVPEKIWKAIMMTESEGNPRNVMATGKELSMGLFQINVVAHPQYANTDLYNPVINANIAARDFIAPAYRYAQQITTDPMKQALITYSGLSDPTVGSRSYLPNGAGIRPEWTVATKNRFINYYNAEVSAPMVKSPSTSYQGVPYKKPETKEEWEQRAEGKSTDSLFKLPSSPTTITSNKPLAFSQSMALGFLIVGLLIIAVIATFKLFGNDISGVLTKLISKGV